MILVKFMVLLILGNVLSKLEIIVLFMFIIFEENKDNVKYNWK